MGFQSGTAALVAGTAVTQFWSLIVYDLETFAFIYNPLGRAGLSSFDLQNMKKNGDESATLYFGPKVPDGLESNWIPTSGKRPLSCRPHLRRHKGVLGQILGDAGRGTS